MAKKHTKQELIAWTQRREGRLIHQLAALSEHDRIRALLTKDTGHLRLGDAEEATPLHYASAVGDPETLKLLLAYGALVNAANIHDETPLLWALIEPDTNDRREKIAALVKARAQINHANVDGETALHQSFRDNQVTKFLLKHGADVHATNIYDWTPLHYTALYDDFLESTLHLLSHQADPNAADDEGLTPLHLSVQNNSIYTATLLINAGANLKAKNAKGQTPFDVADELEADPCLTALLRG